VLSQDFAAQNYGPQPLNQSRERTGRTFNLISEFSGERDGEAVMFSARIQTSRSPSGECATTDVTLERGSRKRCSQDGLLDAPCAL
jgi:hypothetical protein